MSAQSESNLLSGAFEWIKARASRDNEIAAMSHMDMRCLAADLGITEADVHDMVPRETDHSDLMDEMMRAHGLDPGVARRSFSGLVRDMEVICARCRDSRVCRRELESRTSVTHAKDFCANAPAMDRLRKAGS